MLTVRLDKELEKNLEIIAKETNRTKSDIVKEALKEYLEKLENERIQRKKEALEYFINNPINTGIKDLKAIQRIKSESIS